MLAARDRAEGAIAHEWQLETGAAGATVEPVLTWCRDVLSGTRRPFGIDNFDLALAYSHANGVTSELFRLRPTDLYDDATAKRLAAFLAPAESGEGRLAAAVFPWGEAAHRALPSP